MQLLKRISKFLSDKTSYFVIAVAIIAFFLPGGFSWVKGTNQSIIIGIIMFSMGITLSKEDFSDLFYVEEKKEENRQLSFDMLNNESLKEVDDRIVIINNFLDNVEGK